jgi:hypothetical protein
MGDVKFNINTLTPVPSGPANSIVFGETLLVEKRISALKVVLVVWLRPSGLQYVSNKLVSERVYESSLREYDTSKNDILSDLCHMQAPSSPPTLALYSTEEVDNLSTIKFIVSSSEGRRSCAIKEGAASKKTIGT